MAEAGQEVSAPLRLMLFDQTCTGKFLRPRLTHSWRWGGRLYGSLGWLDAWQGASTWAEGLDWLAHFQPDRPISEIQYWGHGQPGRVLMDEEVLDVTALSTNHALRPRLEAVRARLIGPSALWWFRTCSTFGTGKGHQFARAWSTFFNCRAAGHTYVIGPIQAGLHSLKPGEAPSWPESEGGDPPWPIPRWFWLTAPNTISCLHDRVPEDF